MHAEVAGAATRLRLSGVAIMQAPIAVSPPPAGLHARTTIAAGWGDPIGSGAQQAPGAVGGRAQPRQGALLQCLSLHGCAWSAGCR